MTVSILIPHWNRQALLMPLLQSIRQQRLPQGVDVEVLVVDNGSTDESASAAEREGFQVLRLGRNEGVSRALNRGLAACRGEWVAVLNNDVELTPDWLSQLLQAMSSENVWFATGKTLDFDRRARIDGAGDAICRGGTAWRLGHGKEDGPEFGVRRRTYFPSATASLFRRTFFERVGPFEEAFFAYLEDVDLGLRAAIEDLAGLYVPQAVAYHRGSATSGAWSGAMVEWITCHQLLLLAKFYPTRLLMRYARPIFAAQLLWAGLAVSRGGAWAWMRGLWLGIRRFARLRRASQALRRGERLASILRSSEADIARVQGATSWDAYWKWYFRLAPRAAENSA